MEKFIVAEADSEGNGEGEDGMSPAKLMTPGRLSTVGHGGGGLVVGACTCSGVVGGFARKSGSGRDISNDCAT